MTLYALSPTDFLEVTLGSAQLTCGRLAALCRDEDAARPWNRETQQNFQREWRFRHKPRLVALEHFEAGVEVYTWPGGGQVSTSTQKMTPPRIVRLGVLAGGAGDWRIEGPGHLLAYHGRRLARVQRDRAYRTLAGWGAAS